MNTYQVYICAQLDEKTVKEYVIKITAESTEKVYEQLSGLTFEGTVTKIQVKKVS